MLGATYALRHPRTGGYWFRRRVPDHLRPIIGRREITKTLGTKCLSEAKRLSRPYADATDALFDEALGRVGDGASSEPVAAVNDLGDYKIPSHRGIDDWTDDAMFDGIRSFQKDNALKVDGFMRPEGPTEKTINQQLAAIGGGSNKEPPQEACTQPAGWGMFGNGGGKAGGKCPRPGGNDDCDAQYADDGRTCNGVTARLGKEAGARC